MYHIHKKSQKLYEEDEGTEQLFFLSDVESDDENAVIRNEYIGKHLKTRKNYSKKKLRLEVRNKGISKIADKI